jgi:hypothetical protein
MLSAIYSYIIYMIAQDKKENKTFFTESVTYLKNLGYENIKADLDGYETPKSFHKKGTDVVITPDITCTRRSIKYYFEIGLKSEKPKLLKSKWRFLDVLSRMSGNNFKIITKKGHYKFTNEILSDINLDKNLIKL